MSEEFKPIETQEAFDAAIKSRIERAKQSAAEEAKKAFSGWISPDDAKKSADQIAALTGQLSDRDKQIAELTEKVSASDLASMRMKIALDAGLPAALAARLTGGTEEEIKKDAELLASFTKGGGAHRPDPERGEPVSGVEKAFFAKNPNLKM
jgi:hypothetical protein